MSCVSSLQKEARDHREKLKARGAPPFKSSNPPGSLFDSNPNKVDKRKWLYTNTCHLLDGILVIYKYMSPVRRNFGYIQIHVTF